VKKQGKKILDFKLFGQFNAEQRKLFIFAPAAIVITACVLYFGLSSNTTMAAQESQGELDLMLPDAQTKELSDKKQEVFEDLEDHNESIRQDKESDFEVVLDDPLGTEVPTNVEKDQLMTVEKQMEVIEKTQEPVYSGSMNSNSNEKERPLTKAEKDALYREQLLKAREARLARSQDYSVPQERNNLSNSSVENEVTFTASIYRDQFILPGDRVTLILDEPLTYKGNVFKQYTLLYANANIQGSRVLLKVTNIDHVPISLEVKDIQDGNLGMHSDRAGELWREFQSESESNGLNEIGNDVANSVDVPLVGNAIRSFGQFFRKKKYRERDKILLVNNHKIILTSQTN